MKKWTLENRTRWEEEKPNWFTDTCIDGVPNDFIPFEFRVKYKKTKGRVDDDKLRQRRRSSMKALIGADEAR